MNRLFMPKPRKTRLSVTPWGLWQDNGFYRGQLDSRATYSSIAWDKYFGAVQLRFFFWFWHANPTHVGSAT
jgi:hypothetical protein